MERMHESPPPFGDLTRLGRIARSLGELGLLLLAAYLSLATSVARCEWDVQPATNTEGMALDTQVVFRGRLPADAPAITKDAVSWVSIPGNAPVAFEVNTSVEAGTVTLVPTKPLQLGTRYQAFGVDLHGMDGPHYAAPKTYVAPSTTSFSTFSGGPFRVEKVVTSWHPPRLSLLFSWPVDVDSISPTSITIVDTATAATLAWEQPSIPSGSPAVLELVLPDPGTAFEDPAPIEITVQPTVRSVDGQLLDGDGNGTGGEVADLQLLEVQQLPWSEPPQPGCNFDR